MTQLRRTKLPLVNGAKDPNDLAVIGQVDTVKEVLSQKPESVSASVGTINEIEAKTQDAQTPQIEITDTSEIGLAEAFAALHHDLKYVADRNAWFQWDGAVWTKEPTLAAFDRVRDLINSVAPGLSDAESKQLKSAQKVAAIERIARCDRKLVDVSESFDLDPWMINTPSGLINLVTGEIRKQTPSDCYTKITKAGPSGDCRLWLEFLQVVTGGDKSLQRFLQRVIGYGLTGSTREHVLFFLYGTGRNGKGVFLNTITKMLGEYGCVASMEVLTEAHGDRHPTELAALQGKRLVVAQEVDEGRKWAEARIKTLTGGDPVTARFMRGDFFTFDPQFKLLIAGNHKPSFRNVDEAIRARFNLIPFAVTIPKDKRDPDLQSKLEQEMDGIMQWALDGAKAYMAEGLNPPDVVVEATQSYFEDQDTFSQWIEDCCEVGADFWETPTALFKSWERYADAGNYPAGNTKTFKDRLESAGFSHRKTGTRGRHYIGIKAIQNHENHWSD